MRNRLKTVNIFAFVVLGLFLMVSAVISVLTALIPAFSLPTVVQTSLIYALAFGIPAVIYALYVRQKEGQPVHVTLSFRKLPVKSLLLCIALGFLIQPVLSFVASLASLVFQDITTSSIQGMAEMPLVFFIITTGILPAFFEELICRGMMLDGYRNTPLWYMLLIPALFFGMLHLNFQQISYAVVAGVLLAYLVKITGSIWSSMIVHLIINGTQSLLLWITENTSLMDSVGSAAALLEEASPLMTLISASISAGVALPLFILCIFALRRIHGFEEKKKAMAQVPMGWHQGSLLMYVILGIMFLMALLVEFLMPYLNAAALR